MQLRQSGGRRQWSALGVPVIGLNVAATVLAFYLPLVLAGLTDSSTLIGLAVSVDGIAALLIPLFIGPLSDQTWTRYGRRLPYMLAAVPLLVAALVIIPLLPSYWFVLLMVAAFYVGYYVYYTAYQALYPDLLPRNEYGRAWSVLNIFQGVAVALALLGGGALLHVSLAAPFFGAAVVLPVCTLVAAALIHERRERSGTSVQLRAVLPNFLSRLREDRNLRLFLPAHFGWEFTLAALRAFVILYLIKGLGLSQGQLLPILAVIIFAYLGAAFVSGQIADRYDPRRYTAGMIVLYILGLMTVGITTDFNLLQGILPFGFFAGAAVLMLAYPILLRVTPANRHGEYTGYYQFNRGLALIAGSLITGAAIDIFGHHFPSTDGYAVMWLVAAGFAALSLPFYLRLTHPGKLVRHD